MAREEELEQFASCWEGLEDPRSGNATLHDFRELLMIALCCVLCGGQGPTDMALFARAKEAFLRGFLVLENGLPSHDTFRRLFLDLDPDQFRDSFQRFMAQFSSRFAGCGRRRRQGAAPFVRHGQRQVGLAHGLGLGFGTAAGFGANRHRCQVE